MELLEVLEERDARVLVLLLDDLMERKQDLLGSVRDKDRERGPQVDWERLRERGHERGGEERYDAPLHHRQGRSRSCYSCCS